MLTRTDIENGAYYYATEEAHPDNSATMGDFLNNELSDDLGFELVLADGTYAEIIDVTTLEMFEVHAAGNGDANNHAITFHRM